LQVVIGSVLVLDPLLFAAGTDSGFLVDAIEFNDRIEDGVYTGSV
jgi:hypothetical protein